MGVVPDTVGEYTIPQVEDGSGPGGVSCQARLLLGLGRQLGQHPLFLFASRHGLGKQN